MNVRGFPCASCRRGMTLVEILVVLAIITLLMALLLPAVQAVRESGRRARCSNNLRQFGIALISHHDRFNRLPANSPWRGAGTFRKGSMLVSLLPQIEQKSFHDQLDMTGDVVAQIDNSALLRKNSIPTMRCPSDDYPKLNDSGMAVTNYAPSVGAQKTYSEGRCNDFPGDEFETGSCADGEFQGCHWIPPEKRISGPFARDTWAASFEDIPDGASNTILMGEVLPGCSTHLSWLPWWHGQQYFVGTAPPVNYQTCPEEPPGHDGSRGQDCFSWSNWNTDVGFKSRHPGGAGFVFGDASVRFLKQTIDYVNYQRLGCRRDGTEAGQVLIQP